MTTVRRLGGALVLLLAVAARSGAQLSPATIADSARALFAERGIPGGQVVILLDGNPYVQIAIGLADVEAKRPVTDTTLFRVGSIAKLFTATAAAILWERGALDIDAPVSRIVPEFPPEHTGVTPRRLAGHIAGIRHYIPRDFTLPPTHFGDVIDALTIFSADSLVAPPGTRYFYTSYGYNLLGAAIQRAGGEHFEGQLARNILRPLALAHTTPERSDSAFADLAVGYLPGVNGLTRAERTDLSDRYPSGGYLSTATDIAHFAESSVRGPWLTPRVKELLFTTQLLADSAPTNVGFGWRIGADSAGRAFVHHGGASVGGRAMLMAWRDVALVVAITTNLTNARLTEADALMLGRLASPAR